MGRDALEISVSPRQNFLNPPPVPEMPTVTWVGSDFMNSSDTASVMGNTVLDPSILITSLAAQRPGTAARTNVPARKPRSVLRIVSILLRI
jgi:hypothetical protein